MVTATEIAEWEFCQHSWFLRSSGSERSDEALGRLAAGADLQDQRDVEEQFQTVVNEGIIEYSDRSITV